MTDNPVLEEYKLCHAALRNLDEQNWNLGSFLFGGSLAAAGFVLGLSTHVTFGRMLGLSVLSTILLFGLLLYVWRNASVADVIRQRMFVIEIANPNQLGLETSLDQARRTGRFFGVKQRYLYAGMIVLYLGALWFGTFLVWQCPLTGLCLR